MKHSCKPSSLGAALACAAMLFGVAAISTAASAQQTNTASSAAPSGSAVRELDAFARALAGVTKYSATVTIFDQKGAQTQNLVFDYAFSMPSNVTAHVTGGTNTGVTLVWNGGPTIVAHRGSGLAAMFTKTLSLHDPQVTTLNGASIDQLSFGAILSHARQEGAKLSLASGTAIDGVAVNAVTLVPAASAANAGLTREVLELTAATHLPLRLLGYEGSTMVRKIDFANVKLQGGGAL